VAEVVEEETQEEIVPRRGKKKKKKEENVKVSPMMKIYEVIMSEFGTICQSSGSHFLPHLTVGHFAKDKIGEIKETLQENWRDIVFQVTELSMIARDNVNQPFRVIQTVPLNHEESG